MRPGTGPRTRRIRNATEEVDADVWVLTETHPMFLPSEDHSLVTASDVPVEPLEGKLRERRWVSIYVRSGIAATPLPVAGQPDRCVAALIQRPGGMQLLVIGTVLPWRGDRRNPDATGGAGFVSGLNEQAAEWERLKKKHSSASACVAGDFNQEADRTGPVGTPAGLVALTQAMSRLGLSIVTSGDADPLRQRKWRTSIDHVAVAADLVERVTIGDPWPPEYPLPRTLPDHHGVRVSIAGA